VHVGGSYWYDNTTKEGNYWSNWDGNGWGTPYAYPIDGGAGAYDKYPLSQPWTGVARLSERCSGEGFGCGYWQSSEQLVYVDISNGWLHIGADGSVDDYAEKSVSVSLPITVECRMKLVSDGKIFALCFSVQVVRD
jgi:hypothetical protein